MSAFELVYFVDGLYLYIIHCFDYILMYVYYDLITCLVYEPYGLMPWILYFDSSFGDEVIMIKLCLHEKESICHGCIMWLNDYCDEYVMSVFLEYVNWCCDTPSVQILFSLILIISFNSGFIRRGVTIVVSEHCRSVVRS